MKSLLFGMVLGLSLIGSCGVSVVIGLAKEPVTDYEVAVQSAREEQKNVLVIFTLDNCYHCDVLKKDLFNLKGVNDYIVCVLDSRLNKRLTGKMNIKKWPTSIVTTVGKEVQGEVSRFIGYGNKADYEKWLATNAAFFGGSDDACGCDCADDCSCRKDGICMCCGDKCDCCECDNCGKDCKCKKDGKCSCKKDGKCNCKK